MSGVTFTFRGDGGTDRILIPACPSDLLAELLTAQAGQVPPDSLLTIVCSVNGAPVEECSFRAGRISDVREVV